MSQAEPELGTDGQPKCTVCGGEKKDHFDAEGKAITRHVYTVIEGALETQAQRQQRLQPHQVMPPLAAIGGNPMSLGRLVELLLERGVIDTPDALYVAGYGSKPEKPLQTSGYMDPSGVKN